jgi:hypothetical protein
VLCCLVPAVLVLLAGCAPGAVEVEEPDLSAQERAACEELVAVLPDRVADLQRREVEPADAVAAAWGDPAIVLVCGVGAPEDYDPANGCTTVNGIDWYIPMSQLESNGEQDLTMTTIERDVAVQVHMPGEHWPPAAPLADLSESVASQTRATGRCV